MPAASAEVKSGLSETCCALQRSHFGDGIGEEDQEGDEALSIACTICLEERKIGDRCCVLPCGHVFDLECIDKWLERQNFCPNCNQLVSLGAESTMSKIDKILLTAAKSVAYGGLAAIFAGAAIAAGGGYLVYKGFKTTREIIQSIFDDGDNGDNYSDAAQSPSHPAPRLVPQSVRLGGRNIFVPSDADLERIEPLSDLELDDILYLRESTTSDFVEVARLHPRFIEVEWNFVLNRKSLRDFLKYNKHSTTGFTEGSSKHNIYISQDLTDERVEISNIDPRLLLLIHLFRNLQPSDLMPLQEVIEAGRIIHPLIWLVIFYVPCCILLSPLFVIALALDIIMVLPLLFLSIYHTCVCAEFARIGEVELDPSIVFYMSFMGNLFFVTQQFFECICDFVQDFENLYCNPNSDVQNHIARIDRIADRIPSQRHGHRVL